MQVPLWGRGRVLTHCSALRVVATPQTSFHLFSSQQGHISFFSQQGPQRSRGTWPESEPLKLSVRKSIHTSCQALN